MSMRYTQPKDVAAKHTEVLKAMLKRPENKSCADCKRNDPRWASTNLGCFMCIRCSGIHRGMGVHITRIKSVDLDTWTPEQIVHIQRWGNRRANAYWEAHLKSGHAPPEHKMESFIRSKYESKRWAADGPVPEPETLDGHEATTPTATTSAPSASAASRPSARAAPTTAVDLLAGPPTSTSRSQPSLPQVSAPSRSPAPVAAPAAAGGGLFDLDFNAPPPPVAPKRDAKADILSLFASAPPMSPNQSAPSSSSQSRSGSNGLPQGMGGLNLGGSGTGGNADPWGAAPTSSNTQNGVGFGGGFSDFGSAPVVTQRQRSGTDNSNPWGSTATPTTSAPAPAPADPFGDFSSGFGSNATKKSSDAFSDIWS